MKKLWILPIFIICVLLSACGKTPDLYEYAASLAEADLLVRADGTVWRIGETWEADGWLYSEKAEAELAYTIDEGAVRLPDIDEIKKRDATKLNAIEYYMLGGYTDEFAVAPDGSLWIVRPNRTDTRVIAEKFATYEIPEECMPETFWLSEPSIDDARGTATLDVMLHDDSGTLYNPDTLRIDVLIDGKWYDILVSGGDTTDIKLFDENGEYLRSVTLMMGAGYETPVPSGHYRARAAAYVHEAYSQETGRHDWSEKYRRYATLEFDLEYKNGEYKIK